jgi:DNA-binding response OmpR family regulator
MKNILVVEDENRMREFIVLFLRREGYNVIEAENGMVALEKFKSEDIDLIVLDIMMPIIDGFQVCSEIRKISQVPIIILTAIEEENQQVKGYEIGADDYVTKPFKINILMAKVKRIIGKIDMVSGGNREEFGGLIIDFEGRSVEVDGQTLKLAPKEYELLEYLIRNKSIALSREKILDNVWGYDFIGETRVVDNHIKKLRSKLGSYSKHIATVMSVGYKFEVV